MNPWFKAVAGLGTLVPFLLGSLVQAGDVPTGASRVKIVSPRPGQKLVAGQKLTFRAEVDPASNPRSAMLAARLDSGFQPILIKGPPYEATITIPDDWAGRKELFFIVKDASGKMAGSRVITLQVHNPGRPLRLEVYNGSVSFDLDWPTKPEERIRVTAYFDGGRHRDLQRGEPGIRYRSLDPGVATVNADGLIRAMAPGLTLVEIEFRGARTWVPVNVRRGRNPTPPVDLTTGVEFDTSAIRPVSAYGDYVQTVSVTNVSDRPLRSPLFLVLTGLPDGVRVKNRCGKTRSIPPPGLPCVRLSRNGAGSFILLPGESVSVRIEFFSLHKGPIHYVPRVFLARSP